MVLCTIVHCFQVLSTVQCILSAAYLRWHRDHRDDSEKDRRRAKKERKQKDGKKKKDHEKKKKKEKEKKSGRERERGRSRSITREAVAHGRRVSYSSRYYGHDVRRRSPAPFSPAAGRSRCVLGVILACFHLVVAPGGWRTAMTDILRQVLFGMSLGLWTTSRPRLWQTAAGYPPPSRILPT